MSAFLFSFAASSQDSLRVIATRGKITHLHSKSRIHSGDWLTSLDTITLSEGSYLGLIYDGLRSYALTGPCTINIGQSFDSIKSLNPCYQDPDYRWQNSLIRHDPSGKYEIIMEAQPGFQKVYPTYIRINFKSEHQLDSALLAFDNACGTHIYQTSTSENYFDIDLGSMEFETLYLDYLVGYLTGYSGKSKLKASPIILEMADTTTINALSYDLRRAHSTIDSIGVFRKNFFYLNATYYDQKH